MGDEAGRYGALRRCDRCGKTHPLSSQAPGWVATTEPRPAWVCPECCRATGMEPGDPLPEPSSRTAEVRDRAIGLTSVWVVGATPSWQDAVEPPLSTGLGPGTCQRLPKN
jgi:hypothetical protein